MNLLARLRAAWTFYKLTPSDNSVSWLQGDAQSLQAFMKTPSGLKLANYLKNYVLRQQDRAISTSTSLKFNAGACNGSKAILAQIDALAEPQNFTAEDAGAPEIS